MATEFRANVASGKPGRRVDWLDGLRGWAILGVLLVHCGIDVPGLGQPWRAMVDAGQYGVQLFFVVSALTIMMTYERQLAGGHGTARPTAAWWVKRYFRIAPLYYYGIALYFVVFAVMRMRGSLLPANSATDILANILFIHSWVPSAQNTVVPGGWSIGVEMCFYLAVPLIFAAVRTVRGSMVLFVLSVVLAVALDRWLAPKFDGTSTVRNISFLYFWFPTQLPVFFAGIVLYRVAGARLWRPEDISNGVGRGVVIVTAAALSFGLMLGTLGDWDHGLAPTVIAIACCGLAILCQWGPVKDLLINRATVALGRISYSVYINHFAVILLIRLVGKEFGLWTSLPPVLLIGIAFVLALSGAVIAAKITERIIEHPGIELGHGLAASIERKPRRSARLSVS